MIDPAPPSADGRLFANACCIEIFLSTIGCKSALASANGDCYVSRRNDIVKFDSPRHRAVLVSAAGYKAWAAGPDREDLNSPGLTNSIESIPSAITIAAATNIELWPYALTR